MKVLIISAVLAVTLLSGTVFASVDWEQMYNDLKVKYDNLEDRSQEKTKKIKRMNEKIADQRDTIKELKQKVKDLKEVIKDKDEEMKSLQGQSEVVVDTSSSVPNAPFITITIPGDSSVELSWIEPSNYDGSAITGYKVQYSTDGVAWKSVLNPGGSASYTMTDLTNGTEYKFRVSAQNSSGYGPWSNIVTATPNGS